MPENDLREQLVLARGLISGVKVGLREGLGRDQGTLGFHPFLFLYYLNFTDSRLICCNCQIDYKLPGEAKLLDSPLAALGSQNSFPRNSRAVVTLWGIGRK